MLKLSIKCTRFERNYSRCTGRSSENICNSSGGAQEKGKTGWNWVFQQNWWYSEFQPPPPPGLNANVFFCWFFLVSPCVWPNSGFCWCVCLTLRITLLVHRKSLRITQNHPQHNSRRFSQNLFLEIVVMVTMVWHKQLQEIIRFSNVSAWPGDRQWHLQSTLDEVHPLKSVRSRLDLGPVHIQPTCNS
jgi:hypothetical protein